MLDLKDDSELILKFYEHIKDHEAREVFMLLIGAVTCASSLTGRHKKQGSVRSIGVYQGEKCYFAIMPSTSKVKFQLRPPAITGGGFDKQELAAAFAEFDDSAQEGHWNIDLRKLEDCRRLIRHLNWSLPA